MKKVLTILLTIFIFVPLFAQQGTYVRKSISAVESVWIKYGALKGVNKFNYSFFDKMVKHYVEIDRFDYNKLPQSLLNEFRSEANQANYLSAESMAIILNRTVGNQIRTILNDPVIQAQRGASLFEESHRVSFAGSKGKEMGLTDRELSILYNSSYIYLPFINSMTMTEEKGDVRVEIKGGVVWFAVKINENKQVSVELLQASTTYGSGFAERNPKSVLGVKADYSYFTFGNEKFRTTVEEYAQYDAVQAWAKNIGVKTKEIEDFQLTAQIYNISSRSKFKVPLGFKEGVHLDDSFFIKDSYENEQGEIKNKVIGFGRITKTGDNRTYRSNESDAQLFYGKVTQGSVVYENPRLGIDSWVKLGYHSGMRLPEGKPDEVLESFLLYDKEVKEQVVANIGFGYNLAPMIGISQTFFDLELGYGKPIGKLNNDASGLVAYTMSAYGGLSKKFWFGRNALHFNAMAGYDRMAFSWIVTGIDNKLTINAWGIQGGCEYTYMMNQDLQLLCGANMKLGLPPTGVTLEIDNRSYDWSYGGIPEPFSDINFSGLIVRAGVSYSLKELSVNLFGFLDPLKKY
ncbi:MAG: hypothetical protein RBS16_02115 [Candidatus Cloacimonadales bacterium]|jgi:hypothetical protein|nr:hypothetical protein [Candidatus Cloacimonadota bacterium]MDX9976809.1 hypothetical protein [Candidatus Cloacimonadales bacterium]